MTMMNEDIGNNHEVNIEQNDDIINKNSRSNVSFASNVPIIDLMNINHDEVVQQIANACRSAFHNFIEKFTSLVLAFARQLFRYCTLANYFIITHGIYAGFTINDVDCIHLS